jgi:hypothetical protein
MAKQNMQAAMSGVMEASKSIISGDDDLNILFGETSDRRVPEPLLKLKPVANPVEEAKRKFNADEHSKEAVEVDENEIRQFEALVGGGATQLKSLPLVISSQGEHVTDDAPIDEPEKKQRRREMTGEWMSKQIDGAIAFMSMFCFDHFTAPRELQKIVREWAVRVEANTASEIDRKAYFAASHIVNNWNEHKQKYAETVKMTEQERAELSEALQMVMVDSDFNASPWAIVAMIVGGKIAVNATNIGVEKMSNSF